MWLTFQPWHLEHTGVEIVTTEESGERVIRSETTAGMLEARWTLGPDGDWWQTEYPVKTDQDLEAMCAAGSFREDLFYRLAEIVVKIPTLAERPGKDYLY